MLLLKRNKTLQLLLLLLLHNNNKPRKNTDTDTDLPLWWNDTKISETAAKKNELSSFCNLMVFY